MRQKVLTSFLVALLVAPLNVSAAAWMAMSMSNSEQHVLHMTDSDGGHSPHMSSAPTEMPDHSQSTLTHEHDASDCEEHCASCTNHCSSVGIVTSSPGRFDPGHHIAGTIPGPTSNRSELLFRPPILA